MYFTKCINYFLNQIKMLQFNSPETARRTAIHVRISTNKQQTDRQVVELKEYAGKAGITITDDDIFTDIISGFKDGELRPQYSLLKQKIEAGEYQQILFSEFSRLDRKPSNLLRSIESYQKHDVHLYFKKQNLWVKDKSDIASQILISVLAVTFQQEPRVETRQPYQGTPEVRRMRITLLRRWGNKMQEVQVLRNSLQSRQTKGMSIWSGTPALHQQVCQL